MRVCFTGHRPEKLSTGYSITNKRVVAYHEMLKHTLLPLIKERGAHTFLSGGAIGIDQIAFWTVESLKKDFPNIQNNLSIPFKNQYIKWKNDEILEWYHKMFDRANRVYYVDEIPKYAVSPVEIGVYSSTKMQARNMHMVDNSDIVVAVWDGVNSGGTANCVEYARKQGKEIIRLQPIAFSI